MPGRILITGGAGFLGSHVTDRAMREGNEVVVVDNLYTGSLNNIKHHIGHPRFTFVNHDVINPLPPHVSAKKFDYIFHLACAASPVHYQADPIGTTLTCVQGTNNLLREAMRCDCPILISSTSEVYGDPDQHPQQESYWGNVSCTGIRSCYDEGKRCAEALCFDYNRQFGVKIRVARIFNTYGPRMCFNDGRIISNFVVQALRNEDITVYGSGEYTRSFQFCDDLVEGFWRLIHHPTEIGPVNLGNPDEYTVLDMAKMIKEMVGSKSNIVHLPAAKDDPKQRKPDISKAQAVLNGWFPGVNVADGLRRTMEEFASRLSRETCRIQKVYVQCNPLLDISSHVDKAFLDKYGLQGGSAALAEPKHLPMYEELSKRSDVQYIPGGSGLNTARVAHWMTQLPRQSFVSFIGSIADDEYGQILKTSAERDGVTMLVQYAEEKEPTGTCGVLVVGKERSLCANLSAANRISVNHLSSNHVQDAIRDASIYYFTAFTLTVSVELSLKVAKHSAATNGTFVMNLSAPFIMQFFSAQLNEVLPYVDIIVGNEDEAKEFAKMNKWETEDIKEIAKKAVALPRAANATRPRLVVVTQGRHPTILATASGIEEVAVEPIAPEKIIDTNGAGDAFLGGFLAGLAQGKTYAQCAKAGNYSAGVVIQHDGCTFPAKPAFTF